MENVKRIPYGVADFIRIIEDDMYYVDKTMYIPLLEQQPDNLFFIRPRRFGKSLFINMLCAYYDCRLKDHFEQWFGDLWIGSHRTPQQGNYQVLKLDFSRIGGNIHELKTHFDGYCSIMLQSFASYYEADYYPGFAKEVEAQHTVSNMLNFIAKEASDRRIPLFLIIDEYDNFTNVVLNEEGEEVYHALTHASGFYREVFKKFKGMFTRIFITGVSPVTLDDLTSGFNIGWNLSTHPHFNGMLGFNQDEVRTMFRYYQEAGALQGDIEAMIEEMKPWYDNYHFSKKSLETKENMFNSDMVLYYLHHRIEFNSSPDNMLDNNTRTDYGKLKRLINLDRLDGDRKGVLMTVAKEGEIIANVEESFPAKDLTKPDIFPSLLFYYGMLTIQSRMGDMTILGIPNNNVRKQYYEYLIEEYQSYRDLNLTQLKIKFYAVAVKGEWRDAFTFIADAYRENSSVRSSLEGERNIQGFFTAYLSVNAYYLTAPEVELNHGFCDFFLMPDRMRYPEIAHSYIVELKYLPVKDYEAKAETQWQEAVEQIHRYAQGRKVQQLCQETQLHCLVLQFKGWELVRMEEV